MREIKMKLNQNLKNAILTAYSHNLHDTWFTLDREALEASKNIINLCIKNIDNFEGDEKYIQKLQEIAGESLYIINEMMLCWSVEDAPNINKTTKEEPQEKIVYRYIKLDAEKYQEAERKRKKYLFELDSERQRNQQLKRILEINRDKLADKTRELNQEKSKTKDLQSKLDGINKALGAVK